MKKNNWARESAVKIVNKVLREDAYSNIALRQELSGSEMNRLDKALVTEIVNGTIKNLTRLDWVLGQFAKSKKKLDPWVEDIIRAGIYQILYLDRIPDSAVCNESSELARKYGHEGSVKFVNGVLRNISRSKDLIKYPDQKNQPVKYLSVYYSHPEWMIKKLIKDYGYEFTEDILTANNETPPFTIRANKLKTDKEALIDILTKEGMEAEAGTYNPEAIRIRGTSSLEDKESFKNGLYQVQDESSILVSHIVDPKPGELIIDLCSAPGGKSTHMAELMGNKGTVIARDIHQHKLKLIEDSCKRLGIGIVKTELFDAYKLDESLIDKADRVLLDAPCSGLGVIRRKPDLRFKKNAENFSDLAKLQLAILKNAARYVKPEGVLVYSTCTTNKEENIKVIEDFLKESADFYMEDISELLPEQLKCDTAEKGYIELYPNLHNTDGFFISRLRRR